MADDDLDMARRIAVWMRRYDMLASAQVMDDLCTEIVRLRAQVDARDAIITNEVEKRDECREAYAELYGTEQWLRYEWDQANGIISKVTALCDQAERNYGGSPGMANLEAWVHLGALRTALTVPDPLIDKPASEDGGSR